MGSERVKVALQRRVAHCVIFRNFSVKVVARILRRILVTLYIYSWRASEASETLTLSRSVQSRIADIIYKTYYTGQRGI